MPFGPLDFLTVGDARQTRRLRLSTALAFGGAAIVSGILIQSSEQARLEQERTRAASTVERHLRVLDQSMNQALSAAYAMAALVRQGRGKVEDFTGAASQMLQLYPGVGALQLAPDGIIRQSVPLAGNEKAIGHNLLLDPKRTKEAFLARDTRKLTLAGPFSLIQGGLAAVGRLPVFLAESGHETFWGFTSVLIRFPDVLNAGGLGDLVHNGYHYKLTRVHPDTGELQTIAESSAAPLERPVELAFAVPNGQWTLRAAPIKGWQDAGVLWTKIALGGLVSLLFAAVTSLLLRPPLLLQHEVELRTRELKDSEQRFQSLFEMAPVALSVTNETTGYTAIWNKAWLEHFGYDLETAQNRSGKDIGLWRNVADRDAYIERALRDGDVRGFEVVMLRANGEERLVSVSGRFIEAGGQRQLLTCYEDITDARRIEREILDLNSSLEARVQERTTELRQSNAELLQALTSLERTQKELVRAEKLAALGALVAGVAHELNTPIGNSVMVSTSLSERLDELTREVQTGLRRSSLEQFLADLRSGLDILFRNVRRAGDLIASFKQVAVDQASQTRRVFVLDQVIGEIVTTLQPTLKRLPITLRLDIPANVQIDSYPGPLGQVVVNLINNAVVHAFDADHQGFIRISCEFPDADTIRLSVCDNGRGVAAEHLSRIFDPFFTTKLGAGGSGLGLHICYNLVTTVLGGNIRAESNLHNGTCVVVEMPRIAPRAAAEYSDN
jgi:PAS domain S-box-containing protein